MKLFLTSYIAGTELLLKEFLEDYSQKNILFIPTAGNVEEYTDYIDEGIKVLENLGYTIDLLDISTADRENIIDAIKSCGCLCVSGGNTFYLLQELKRKNLIEVMSDEISRGMIYIGESAGAMIVSKSIEYSNIMDDESAAPDLNNYSGINIFDKYIIPHYGEEPFEEIAERMLTTYSDSLELVPINNHQAVVVEDNKYLIVGNN